MEKKNSKKKFLFKHQKFSYFFKDIYIKKLLNFKINLLIIFKTNVWIILKNNKKFTNLVTN